MAIKLNSIKCPECGALLSIEPGREQLFCSYCGCNIIVTNENEKIIRHIDEAKIKSAEAQLKEAEANHDIELRKLELIERNRRAIEGRKKIKIGISIILGAVGLLMIAFGAGMVGMAGLLAIEIVMYIWILSDGEDNDPTYIGDMVRIPHTITDYEEKHYTAIQAAFESAGFKNVKSVPLNDLKMGLLKKPGRVESITIKGQEIRSWKKKYPSDVPVIISYHSFVEK